MIERTRFDWVRHKVGQERRTSQSTFDLSRTVSLCLRVSTALTGARRAVHTYMLQSSLSDTLIYVKLRCWPLGCMCDQPARFCAVALRPMACVFSLTKLATPLAYIKYQMA